ncbi:hypothetical protein T01_7461 [Trichinella spiralis]|uniref:Uncharacterized protein n=1 Tax=Trichinella spiralis TaxID=6334 RepID=A0A0V1ALU4_TRISP|nr:hypothetical protein T01_7461 [Trichinella spiralis]
MAICIDNINIFTRFDAIAAQLEDSSCTDESDIYALDYINQNFVLFMEELMITMEMIMEKPIEAEGLDLFH